VFQRKTLKEVSY